jgi:hypothetical protein
MHRSKNSGKNSRAVAIFILTHPCLLDGRVDPGRFTKGTDRAEALDSSRYDIASVPHEGFKPGIPNHKVSPLD